MNAAGKTSTALHVSEAYSSVMYSSRYTGRDEHITEAAAFWNERKVAKLPQELQRRLMKVCTQQNGGYTPPCCVENQYTCEPAINGLELRNTYASD